MSFPTSWNGFFICFSFFAFLIAFCSRLQPLCERLCTRPRVYARGNCAAVYQMNAVKNPQTRRNLALAARSLKPFTYAQIDKVPILITKNATNAARYT